MSDSTLPLFFLQPETKEIPLTQGRVAIVDAADYEWLAQWKWHAYKDRNTWYVRRTSSRANGKQRTHLMHREILGVDANTLVDHKDGNGLNNTRDNLRAATNQQNQFNRGMSRNNTSGYKGVRWHSRMCKWVAIIKPKGKVIYLGSFVEIENAAKAYDEAALKYFGEFARLNFEKE